MRAMIVLVVVAVMALVVLVRVTLPPLRRRRIAAELRGDWWPRFEREFHAYASRAWETTRDAEQKN
jgi:hypothetical protein